MAKSKSGVVHLYLIRHGETLWNSTSRWQGQIDVPLTERGMQQARSLADYLRDRPITAVYTSDLARARVTGEIIAQAFELQVKTDIRLREMNLGVLQGLTKAEIDARYPHELQGLNDNWLDHRVEGGETRRMMQARLVAALEDMMANAQGPDVAVVSHGGAIRTVLQHYFPGNPDALKKPIENTSMSTFTRDGDGWTLEAIAETPHLTPHAPPMKPLEAQ